MEKLKIIGGERLSGDRSTTSPYSLSVKKDESCVFLCRKSLNVREFVIQEIPHK